MLTQFRSLSNLHPTPRARLRAMGEAHHMPQVTPWQIPGQVMHWAVKPVASHCTVQHAEQGTQPIASLLVSVMTGTTPFWCLEAVLAATGYASSSSSDSSRCAWITSPVSNLWKSRYFKKAGDRHSPASKIFHRGAPGARAHKPHADWAVRGQRA